MKKYNHEKCANCGNKRKQSHCVASTILYKAYSLFCRVILIDATWENARFDYPEINKWCCCIVYNLRKTQHITTFSMFLNNIIAQWKSKARNLLTENDINGFVVVTGTEVFVTVTTVKGFTLFALVKTTKGIFVVVASKWCPFCPTA